MAFTFTGDLGCETGDGVTCHGGKGGPKQAFLGWMAYNRVWWHKDLFGLTLGGGQISNPGRYLALVLPVNGSGCNLRYSILSRVSGGDVQGVRCHRNFRLHAKAVFHVPH